MGKIASSIENKLQQPGLINKLSEKLSLSELNSLLLEIIGNKTKQITPAQLLKHYIENKFTSPASIDPIEFMKRDIELLKTAKGLGYEPTELSPVTPLGTSSVVGTVNQHKVISALRGVEVLADATNVLALEISKRRKEQLFDGSQVKFCTSHRHVRAQDFNNPGWNQHFRIFCMTDAGRDTGNFEFEKKSLFDQLSFYEKYLRTQYKVETVNLLFKSLDGKEKTNLLFESLFNFICDKFPTFKLEKTIAAQDQQPYYKGLQFKITITINGNEIEIGDGGFVDWTQQLTGNKKERLLISGLGTERLLNLYK